MTDQDALFILGLIVSAALWVLALFISDPEDTSEGYKGGRTPDRYKMTITIPLRLVLVVHVGELVVSSITDPRGQLNTTDVGSQF